MLVLSYSFKRFSLHDSVNVALADEAPLLSLGWPQDMRNAAAEKLTILSSSVIEAGPMPSSPELVMNKRLPSKHLNRK